MFNGSFWRAIDVTRCFLIQRRRRPLERSNGNGKRSCWADGQLERMPFAGQDLNSIVRDNLPGSMFSFRGCQQSSHNTYDYWTPEGLAETVLHRTQRQGQIHIKIIRIF